ncbi:hypothetical protein [Marininema halotolerans]|uniref:MSP domain-containing protein n=1 Tax=Marininema halotolerans TaxID=1155944 RepID=A0A1I6P790_9BACL|nr:hypothetical protein [Marininema halotolerans]SFS36051.1 hypothetical protein SAMN05444972_101405 [Marininema halotolerans]
MAVVSFTNRSRNNVFRFIVRFRAPDRDCFVTRIVQPGQTKVAPIHPTARGDVQVTAGVQGPQLQPPSTDPEFRVVSVNTTPRPVNMSLIGRERSIIVSKAFI